LSVADSAGGASIVLSLVPDHAVKARNCEGYHQPHEANEVADEENHKHDAIEQCSRVVQVAIVLVRVEYIVAVVHSD
jgi:hypothetical protein